VLVHNIPSPFFTGPLRSPARFQNTFAHESFMDELAWHAKADPVEYRLRHLSNQRVMDVLQAAAKAANWNTRPSPRSGIPKSGVATGRGVACVAYEGDNGYTGIVTEVEVDQDTGKIAVKRVFVAIDAGPISNPDGLKNQAEGGALQGMSRALLEEVTWDEQRVTSIDWRTYRSLPLGFPVPKVECVLLNRPEEEATGAGETSITVIAAAIGNAVFDATGARLRQIPFTPERVKAALKLFIFVTCTYPNAWRFLAPPCCRRARRILARASSQRIAVRYCELDFARRSGRAEVDRSHWRCAGPECDSNPRDWPWPASGVRRACRCPPSRW
jgi:nicotinate dehydrogenase subunit B